jgi:hypothetical protein
VALGKDATTGFADEVTLNLKDPPGTPACGDVTYRICVKKQIIEKDFRVSGTITVKNPAPCPVTIKNVTDVVSGGINATLSNCKVNGVAIGPFPVVLPAGGTLTCDYSASLPDKSTRTNTATATIQNTPSGTTDFTGTAVVDFANAKIIVVGSQTVCVVDTDDRGHVRNFGPFSGDYCVTYNVTYCCPDDKGYRINKACIDFNCYKKPSYICDTATVHVICKPQENRFCTYTQGGFGAPPHGNNPGALLAAHPELFPITIGCCGNTLTFDNQAEVEAFLPAGGTPGMLPNAGVFAGQVLALSLNIKLSDLAITPAGFGDLVLCGTNVSVRHVLADANVALGTGALPPYVGSIAELNDLVTNLNEAFDDCTASSWAEQHLCSP